MVTPHSKTTKLKFATQMDFTVHFWTSPNNTPGILAGMVAYIN